MARSESSSIVSIAIVGIAIVGIAIVGIASIATVRHLWFPRVGWVTARAGARVRAEVWPRGRGGGRGEGDREGGGQGLS